MNAHGQDPVSLFARVYKPAFSKAVIAFFDNAVRQSQIDVRQNRQLSKKIAQLDTHLNKLKHKKKQWTMVVAIFLLICAVWIGWYVVFRESTVSEILRLNEILFFIFFGFGSFFIFSECMPAIKGYSTSITDKDDEMNRHIAYARKLLEPLFAYFDWNTAVKLTEQVLPHLRFDSFLDVSRLEDLQEHFDFRPENFANHTILHTYSGTYYGYPFVLITSKVQRWGSETYSGSKTIYWTETKVDSDGKPYRVPRVQVLTAHVTEAVPEYEIEVEMIFGHDAAPNLSFTRKPTTLSGTQGTFLGNLGKKIRLGSLRRLERNLTDDKDFTMMNNHDFEVFFHSTDRDHEVEYRLLFTPLAQRNMVSLLSDKKEGYGDDFFFGKVCKCIHLFSSHVRDMDMQTSSFYSSHYDLTEVRNEFRTQYQEFFRSIYFAFAPLQAIPIYNEPRVKGAVYGYEDSALPRISSWELETLANHHGENEFCHPETDTQCIMKVDRVTYSNSGAQGQLTTRSFKKVPRVTSKSMLGGDGNWHIVDVKWYEYVPLKQTMSIEAKFENPEDYDLYNGTFHYQYRTLRLRKAC